MTTRVAKRADPYLAVKVHTSVRIQDRATVFASDRIVRQNLFVMRCVPDKRSSVRQARLGYTSDRGHLPLPTRAAFRTGMFASCFSGEYSAANGNTHFVASTRLLGHTFHVSRTASAASKSAKSGAAMLTTSAMRYLTSHLLVMRNLLRIAKHQSRLVHNNISSQTKHTTSQHKEKRLRHQPQTRAPPNATATGSGEGRGAARPPPKANGVRAKLAMCFSSTRHYAC